MTTSIPGIMPLYTKSGTLLGRMDDVKTPLSENATPLNIMSKLTAIVQTTDDEDLDLTFLDHLNEVEMYRMINAMKEYKSSWMGSITDKKEQVEELICF